MCIYMTILLYRSSNCLSLLNYAKLLLLDSVFVIICIFVSIVTSFLFGQTICMFFVFYLFCLFCFVLLFFSFHSCNFFDYTSYKATEVKLTVNPPRIFFSKIKINYDQLLICTIFLIIILVHRVTVHILTEFCRIQIQFMLICLPYILAFNSVN